LNVCFRVRYTWLTHHFLCGYCDRFPQVISNPVASELILPTLRTRRRAVSRKLIGRLLHRFRLHRNDQVKVNNSTFPDSRLLTDHSPSCMSVTGIDITSLDHRRMRLFWGRETARCGVQSFYHSGLTGIDIISSSSLK
jgi:hypothetical protein